MLALKRDLHHLRAENGAMREKLSLPAEGAVMDYPIGGSQVIAC